jgi:hypothetical protein
MQHTEFVVSNSKFDPLFAISSHKMCVFKLKVGETMLETGKV